MTCIEDLFDWILEEIFTKLSRHDRLVCKEVCKRWNNLLMERVIFQEDCRIFLKIDEIIFPENNRALLRTLTNAKYPYRRFTIDDDAEDENYYNVLRFFVHFGASIEDLNYMGPPSSLDIFTTMTSLKSLTLTTLDLKEASEMFSKIQHNNHNFAFHHLERLQLGYFCSLDSAIHYINKIKTYIPQNCSIILSQAEIFSSDLIELVCQLMEVIKINEITVDVAEISKFSKLLESNHLNCDTLKLDYRFNGNIPTENPYCFLEKLQNKHQNLEKLDLTCFSLPLLPTNLPKLNVLHIQLSSTLQFSLKPLEQLTNLKELRLDFKQKACGGHEPLSMPKLKRFTIYAKSLCNECIQAIINSFENLTDIILSFGEAFTWNIFKTLIDSWKNLETIQIIAKGATQHDQKNLNLSFERNEHLREIKIGIISHLKLDVIQRMSLSFPNLETLELKTSSSLLVTPVSFVVEAVVLVFTKLKSLTFWYRPIEVQTYGMDIEIKHICNYLENVGFQVEDREVHKAANLIQSKRVELTLNRKKMTAKIEFHKW